MRARWRLESRVSASSALTVFSLTGDVDGALSVLGVPGVTIGNKGLRDFAGVDEALVARPSASCVWIVTHGGRAVEMGVRRAFASAGIAEGTNEDDCDLRTRYPEAIDEIESRVLDALPRAAGLFSVERLLGEPARWRGSGLGHFEGLRLDAPAGAFAPRVLDRLLNPPSVVLVGRANIGKSTLVNTMARRAVSIVAPTPGTTRDHVGVDVDFGGLVARVIDTPGVREIPQDDEVASVEQSAAGLAQEAAVHADLMLICSDPLNSAAVIGGAAGYKGTTLHVCLRRDLGRPRHECDAAVSAHTGAGLDDLYAAIRESLVPQVVLHDPRPWRFWDARASTVKT